MITKKDELTDILTIVLSLTCVYFVIWAFTGMWPFNDNPYNSFALQANSWLQGRLDLGRDYPHLELAIYAGKFYVSFPPFPSFVILPFALFFGTKTPDGFITFIVSLIGAIYALKLLRLFGKKGKSAIFWVMFLIAGSNVLFVQVNGWVWFIAQNMSFTLSVMAIYYAEKGKGGLSLFFWACAVGCRPFQAVYILLLLYILYKNHKRYNPSDTLPQIIRKRCLWIIPPVSVAVVYMILNYMRFKNPVEFGHNYLPEFVRSEQGQFSLVYLKDNLLTLFTLPGIAENKALAFSTLNRLAFFIVSPIFISFPIYLACSFRKKNIDRAVIILTPLLIALHFVLICAHKTMGGWHFGNRYTVDALPFLFYGLINFFHNQNERLEQLQYPLFILGFGINIVGTITAYAHYI